MMKIFLALFISFACAAKFSELKHRTIEKASTSRLNRLNSDAFYIILTFLSAEEALGLKILSKEFYCKVKNLWPKMTLSTIIEGFLPDFPVDFSHSVEIRGMNLKYEQIFPYSRAQLSCLREFSLDCEKIHDLQAVIDLLPRDSLTNIRLENSGPGRLFIKGINFPKLTHLELNVINTNQVTFSSLPNCVKVLKVNNIYLDVDTSLSLARAIGAMYSLEVLSLTGCAFPRCAYGLSAILENLPASLRSLDISCIGSFRSHMKLSEPGLKRLKEMEYLQEITFIGTSYEFGTEIILNLPKCITDIKWDMRKETLNAFQQRPNEFTKVRRIYPSHETPIELFPFIRKIFPSLDEDTKKTLDSLEFNL